LLQSIASENGIDIAELIWAVKTSFV